MDVTIRGHNLKISDNLRDYTENKLDKLDRYLPHIADVHVDLSRQNTARGVDWTVAQITLRHRRGAILRAEEKLRGSDNDATQAAIGQAVDKMYRRIQRFKGKGKRNRRGRERFVATTEELDIAEALPGYEDVEEVPEEAVVEAEEQEIVRRKDIPVSAMNEVEAIEQMELLGHNFFVFYNVASGSVNILYKRTAGGYGVLVPQIE